MKKLDSQICLITGREKQEGLSLDFLQPLIIQSPIPDRQVQEAETCLGIDMEKPLEVPNALGYIFPSLQFGQGFGYSGMEANRQAYKKGAFCWTSRLVPALKLKTKPHKRLYLLFTERAR